MDWLFGAPGQLVLQPDSTGKSYAGFYSGESLTLTAKSKDTIASVMVNFNAYRAPDQQIHELWTREGTVLPFSTPLGGKRVIAIVRRRDIV